MKKAEKICLSYKSLMKIKNEGKQWDDKQSKQFKKLPKSVAKASRHLCRTLLCYKGKSYIVVLPMNDR